MNKRKVWRYSCEFCSKGYFKSKQCAQHERGCAKNPQRICGICDRNSLGLRTPNEILCGLGVASRLTGKGEWSYDTEELRKAALGCPLCMLAAVFEINKREGYRRGTEEYCAFDYLTEMKRFISEKRVANCDEDIPF
jgi:hypothetical protein